MKLLVSDLTEDEQRVLRETVKDLPKYKIATKLILPRRKVDRITAALCAKHGVATRQQLMTLYYAKQNAAVVGLTIRQNQMLRLVLERKTNPEIADALFMGSTRVVVDLGKVYQVLGVRGRQELFERCAPHQFATVDAMLHFLNQTYLQAKETNHAE